MAAHRKHDEAAPADPEVPAEPAPARPAHAPAEGRLGELEAECEELRARAMRAQADYQNLRRRAQSDLEAGVRRAVMPLLEELLLVADYLDLALAVTPVSEEAKNLAVGVEMTRGKLLQALEREEVRPIRAQGLFDPELHEATGTEPRSDVPAGTVLRTVRPGYTWRGSVLRHAHVIVAAAPDQDAGAGGGAQS